MTEERVRIAAQLYEARDQVRQLLGDAYSARMAEYGKAIRAIAENKNLSLLRAGIAAAKTMQNDGQAYTAVVVLAATVELLEPSPAPAAPESRD